MTGHLTAWLFPPKCVLCHRLLSREETDLCSSCRTHTPPFSDSKKHFPFLAGWTALWYYRDDVRRSLLQYKFYNRRSYAGAYGRLLAMKLQTENMDGFDILTWVPIGRFRRWKRGYDQVQLLAEAAAKELHTRAVPTLVKTRNNPPQSRISRTSARRANVMNAYRVTDPGRIAGKRILLLDDIITTGATISECAKTLMIAGAEEVRAAAVASALRDNSISDM